jgi:hypothetical protein
MLRFSVAPQNLPIRDTEFQILSSACFLWNLTVPYWSSVLLIFQSRNIIVHLPPCSERVPFLLFSELHTLYLKDISYAQLTVSSSKFSIMFPVNFDGSSLCRAHFLYVEDNLIFSEHLQPYQIPLTSLLLERTVCVWGFS